MANNTPLPPLPGSWSALTWRQLLTCWSVKQRYGGNADVARAAAFLELSGLKVVRGVKSEDAVTGEDVYLLQDRGGCRCRVTPRELSYMAREAVLWFDYPYGDPGEEEQKDEKGNVVRERRKPHAGYVSLMKDAMIIPLETVKIGRRRFALPQAACNNLTWQQYRSLQAIAPQLFGEGLDDKQAVMLQSQFLAHILTPRSIALFDTSGGSIRLRPHYEYRYDAGLADSLAVRFARRPMDTLFHICFQAYQTAMGYYAGSYPLLFHDSGKTDPLRDALTGEVGTINTIMKYAGYADQQQVYDSNLPFVLDILNTMTKEAKEIEKMNSKIKRK